MISAYKFKMIQEQIDKLETVGNKSRTIKIRRLKANSFFDKGKCDHTGTQTIFG